LKPSTKLFRYQSSDPHSFPIPIVKIDSSLDELKRSLSTSPSRCVLILTNNHKLVNLITQGDFLRYDLNNKDKSLKDLLQVKPTCLSALNASSAHEIISAFNVTSVPIKDVAGNLVGAIVRDASNTITKTFDTKGAKRLAIIVAGGKGSRLGPLTKDVPKPLLMVAGKPLIEYVMTSLAYIGFDEFHVLCGYLPESFVHFASTTRFNVHLNFEDTPLNTGGPLLKWIHDEYKYLKSLVTSNETVSLIVANGDLLFDVDESILDTFNESSSQIAIIGRTIETPIKYGTMVVSEGNYLQRFVEKPIVEHLANIGVYLLKLDARLLEVLLEFDPQAIGMPQLLEITAKKLSQPILVINVNGSYLDLGTPDDLSKLKSLLEE